MSDNIRTVKLSRAKSHIKRAFNKKRPVFIWGPPGVGKSDILAQIAEEGNNLLIDLRMALLDPTDIKGYPYRDEDTNKMMWAAPAELPSEELASQYETVFLFLDELNSAPPSVQATAYQLILNRRVGQYVLPDNVVIAAAGNRDTDKGVTYRMPSPLANRFLHLEVEVNHDDWQFGQLITTSIQMLLVTWLLLNKTFLTLIQKVQVGVLLLLGLGHSLAKC